MKTILRDDAVSWLRRTLRLDDFPGDPSNNGLQVAGKPEIGRAVFAVDACRWVIEKAIKCEADFIFVHHGISWGGGLRRLDGFTATRLKLLFSRDINLYASHLPLDAACDFGNNACLARIAGLTDLEPYCVYHGMTIGCAGRMAKESAADALRRRFEEHFGCRAALYGDPDRVIRRVAVCSGGGGNEALEQAAEIGADLLLTGEMQHEMFHPAMESGVAVLALGHYTSETVGPKALMEKFSGHFGIDCEFVDCKTYL